jgi:hypothetical protein
MGTPTQVEMVIGMRSAADADEPTDIWDLLRQTVAKGHKSIDQRLEPYRPLEPERFGLQEPPAG